MTFSNGLEASAGRRSVGGKACFAGSAPNRDGCRAASVTAAARKTGCRMPRRRRACRRQGGGHRIRREATAAPPFGRPLSCWTTAKHFRPQPSRCLSTPSVRARCAHPRPRPRPRIFAPRQSRTAATHPQLPGGELAEQVAGGPKFLLGILLLRRSGFRVVRKPSEKLKVALFEWMPAMCPLQTGPHTPSVPRAPSFGDRIARQRRQADRLRCAAVLDGRPVTAVDRTSAIRSTRPLLDRAIGPASRPRKGVVAGWIVVGVGENRRLRTPRCCRCRCQNARKTSTVRSMPASSTSRCVTRRTFGR